MERLPISEPTRRLAARMGRAACAWAPGGGEDYELCLAAQTEVHEELPLAVREARGTRVAFGGEVLHGRGGRRVGVTGGEERRLTEAGWDHFGGGTQAGILQEVKTEMGVHGEEGGV